MTAAMTEAIGEADSQDDTDGSGPLLRVRPSRLTGSIRVSGAKNSVLRLLAASLLTSDEVVLHNYPATLLDAGVHVEMLEMLGKSCSVTGETLIISAETASPASDLDWQGRSIRNTLLVLGALVARTGSGRVPLPGGCDIGDRKYDLHELVLTSLGAKVWAEDGFLCASAPDGLTGAEIVLPLRSTGATEQAIIAGSLARGRTVLYNPHMRPEIIDLIAFIEKMGAKVAYNGQESIVVEGAQKLSGVSHTVMPDNMEAMTWLTGALLTGGDIEIADFPFDDLEVPLIFAKASGARVFREGSTAIIRSVRPFPVEISTGPYPGINSDMQPLFAAIGACARGVSKLVDLRFQNRFDYLKEFAKMGVEAHVSGGTAEVRGGRPLSGAHVVAVDLRAGAALAMLGLVANGETKIENAWQIERGYDRFVEKGRLLGGDLTIVAG